MAKQTQNCASNQHSRHALRKHYRQIRRNLNAFEQQQAAKELAKQLTNSAFYLRSKNIAVYWPDDGEISLLPFIEQAWRMKKRVFLPVITLAGQMQFARFTQHSRLVKGRWGIVQPAPARTVSPLRLDTILLPLVAFDAQGNRLGRGGGFYDRFLNKLSRFTQQHHKLKFRGNNPLVIGVAHQCQQTQKMNSEPWDIPVDAVITDKNKIIAN